MEAGSPPGRAIVAVSLTRCLQQSARPAASGGAKTLVERIGRNVAQLAASQLASDLRRRVFLLEGAPRLAPDVAAAVVAPSDVVPLARSASLPTEMATALPPAEPLAGPARARSVPTTPTLGDRSKRGAPANPARMLWRCVACGMATELDQLEPSADGTGFVHTSCGAVCMSSFVSGDGVEKRSRRDDQQYDENARADFRQESRVPWYVRFTQTVQNCTKRTRSARVSQTREPRPGAPGTYACVVARPVR